jgi:hypothetical protein
MDDFDENAFEGTWYVVAASQRGTLLRVQDCSEVIVTQDTFSITDVFFPKLLKNETNILQGMLELADNTTQNVVAEFNFIPLIFGDILNFTFDA